MSAMSDLLLLALAQLRAHEVANNKNLTLLDVGLLTAYDLCRVGSLR
jgi:hypothetical protein